MAEFFPGSSLTIVASPEQAAALLASDHYALVVLTNFGIGPREAVTMIPDRRDYTVFFLTGHVDSSIEAVCRSKQIHYRTMPIAPDVLRRELRIALDDPGL